MSKRVEALHELRNMTAEDLLDHLRQQRRRLFEVRFQQAAGQVENHRQIRDIRREIARTMTVQEEIARGFYPETVVETESEDTERPERRRRFGRGDKPAVEAEPETDVESPPEAAAEPGAVDTAAETGVVDAAPGVEPAASPAAGEDDKATAAQPVAGDEDDDK
jgi:large subunit ribosomal protein L29